MNTNQYIQSAKNKFSDRKDAVMKRVINPNLTIQENITLIATALKHLWKRLVDKETLIKEIGCNRVGSRILCDINDEWDNILKRFLTCGLIQKINHMIQQILGNYSEKKLPIQKRFKNGKAVYPTLITIKNGLLEIQSSPEEEVSEEVWVVNNELFRQFINEHCRDLWPRGASKTRLTQDIDEMVENQSLPAWNHHDTRNLIRTIYSDIHPDIVAIGQEESLIRIPYYIDLEPEYVVFAIKEPGGKYSTVFGGNIKQSIKPTQIEVKKWGVVVHQKLGHNLKFSFANTKVVFWTARSEKKATQTPHSFGDRVACAA